MQRAVADRYQLAFASLPEPTLLVDRRGRLEGVNGAARALLGPGLAKAAARRERARRALPWLGPALTRVLAGAAEAALEAEAETPAGRRCVGARVRALEADGALRGAVVVLADVTADRELDLHLRSAERQAAVETLAAGLAHEVNNPLACVVSGLSFAEAEHARLEALAPAELSEVRAALEEARAAALRVGRIVRALQRLGGDAPLDARSDVPDAVRAALRLGPVPAR
jgi:PAS domain-containing protein